MNESEVPMYIKEVYKELLKIDLDSPTLEKDIKSKYIDLQLTYQYLRLIVDKDALLTKKYLICQELMSLLQVYMN